MINRNKKYLAKRDGDHPSVGNLVHWYILELNLKKKNIAEELGIVSTTLNEYFKNQSLQFSIVWRLSQAMKFNLIMALGEHLNIPFETKAEKALRAELAEKEEKIKALETELLVYRKIVDRLT